MPKFRIHYDEENNVPIYDKYFSKDSLGFRTKNSSYFKSIVAFLNNIVEHTNFKLEKSGIHILSLDKGHVALVDCFIPYTFFSNYVPKVSDISIGLNVNILMKILNHLNHDDELIFKYNDDTLDICFINPKYQKFYSIKLMNIECDELAIQKYENSTTINIESKYFQEIIKDFIDIGDNVRFNISKEYNENNQNIELECSGDMTGVRMVLCNDDLTIKNLQNINLEFSLKNLDLFSKGYNLNKFMTIDIDQNFPLKLSYQIMDTGYLTYYLAPRIED